MLLAVFVLVAFLSTTFLFIHAHHEHDHDGPEGACATCIQLDTVQHLLKNIFSSSFVSVAALSALLIFTELVSPISHSVGFHTLVLLKVRLNN